MSRTFTVAAAVSFGLWLVAVVLSALGALGTGGGTAAGTAPPPGAPGTFLALRPGELRVTREVHDGRRHEFPGEAGGGTGGPVFVGVERYASEGIVGGWPRPPGAAGPPVYFHRDEYRVSLTALVVVLAIPPGAWVWNGPARRRATRRRAGRCPTCGYDLRGSADGRCPECGLYPGSARDPSEPAQTH